MSRYDGYDGVDDVGLDPGQCPIRSKQTRAAVEGLVPRNLPMLKRHLTTLANTHPDLDLTHPLIQDWVMELVRKYLFRGIAG